MWLATVRRAFTSLLLDRHGNQARGLAQYSIEFLAKAQPSATVLERLKLFHLDAMLCAASALASGANGCSVLRKEAMGNRLDGGAKCLGSEKPIRPEKAVMANCSAVREWDMNGSMFGYHPRNPTQRAGEFGQNDFYPVAAAAAQVRHLSGQQLVLGMLLADEVRGRLAQAFSLRAQGVDHVLYGGVASACVYGALVGASEKQIEQAIGMVVSHYAPTVSVRKGLRLSDSKGAASALIAEAAVLSVTRCMNGFQGPEDIFRQPWTVFRRSGDATSAFDLELGWEGDDFAIQTMHFKLGLCAHITAGAQLGLLSVLLQTQGRLRSVSDIHSINVSVFKVLFEYLCQPSKRRPKNRSSADHSLYYVLARLLHKALARADQLQFSSIESLWKDLILMPEDYTAEALNDPVTLQLMDKINVEYGGPEYEQQYPEGLPSRLHLNCAISQFDSGLVVTPPGFSTCVQYRSQEILEAKFQRLGTALKDYSKFDAKLRRLDQLSAAEVQTIYDCQLNESSSSIA